MGRQNRIRDFGELGKHFGIQPEQKDIVQKLQVEEKEQPNISWLYYKKYYHGLYSLRDEYDRKIDVTENKNKDSKIIEEYFEEENSNIINTVFEKEKRTIVPGLIRFELKTTYPGLLIGSGMIHETGLLGEAKLGFQFDHTTGLPCIPGSSIKGLLRSVFPYSIKDANPSDKKEIAKVDNYRKERISYLQNITEIKTLGLNESEIRVLEYAVFAGTNGKDALKCQQRDVFFDAVITDAPKRFLGLDYITPHKPLKNPIPIKFFKILPNVTFSFSFKLYDTVLYKEKAYTPNGLKQTGFEVEGENVKVITAKKKIAIFKQILLDFGVGAKTNVGYGQFSE